MSLDVVASREAQSKVFVSYSRRDREFVAWLHQALEQTDVDVFRDLEDTLPGEEWWTRLRSLISASDTIVFVLSHHSAASKVCADELSEATKLGKRIIPIMIEPVDWNTVPQGLASLHSLDFTQPDSWDQSLQRLISALAVDIEWVREHTRIGELAQHWLSRGKRASALLRGPSIADAERWATSRPPNSSMTIDHHVDFIASSRRAQTRRSRIFLAVAALVAISAIALSVWAEVNRREADARRAEAVTEREVARQQRAAARVNERRAYAELAEAVRLQGIPTDALKLALASWPRTPDEGQMFEKSLNTLSDTMRDYRFPVATADDVGGLIVSPDKSRAVYRELGPRIYGLSPLTGTADGTSAELDDQVDGGTYNSDGSLIAFWSFGGFAVADSDLSKVRFRFADEGFEFIDGFFAGTFFVGRGNTGGVAAWDTETGEQVWLKAFPYRQELIEASPEGSKLLFANESRLDVLDTASGTGVAHFDQAGVTFTGGRFEADGRSILLWDISDQFYRASIDPPGELMPIYSAPVQSPEERPTFSPDGRTFLVGDIDSIETRSAETGATVWGPRAMPWGLWRAEFSPDGTSLLVTHNDATFSYLDPSTGEVLGTSNGLKGVARMAAPLTAVVATDEHVTFFVNARDARVAPGRMVAVDGADELQVLFGGKYVALVSRTHLYIWSIAADSAAATPIAKHQLPVAGADAIDAGTKIVSWSDGGSVMVSTLDGTGTPLAFGDPIGQLTGVAISPARDEIVTYGQNGAVLYETATGKKTVLSRSGSYADPAVAFSADGTRLTVVQDGGLQLWAKQDGAFAKRSSISIPRLAGTDIAGIDTLIGWNERLHVWKSAGTDYWTAPSRGRWISNAVASRDGSKLLACGIDGDVVVYSLEDFSVVAEQQLQIVIGCSWSPDESKIVAWASSTAFVLDASSGTILLEAPSNGRSDSLGGAVLSDNGQTLLTWSERGVSMAWEMTTGKSLTYRDTDWVSSGALNSDGTRALTTSRDGNTRILDTKTMKQIGYTHTGSAGARFIENEASLLVWSTDGRVEIWQIDSDDKGWLLDSACARLESTSLDDIEAYYGFGKIDPICTPSQLARLPDDSLIVVPPRR